MLRAFPVNHVHYKGICGENFIQVAHENKDFLPDGNNPPYGTEVKQYI